MPGTNELVVIACIAIAALSVMVHYRLLRISDSGLFAYYLIMAAAIAIPAVALTLVPADPVAQAAADLGILMAGVMAFAAAGWLSFAFGVAGDPGDH